MDLYVLSLSFSFSITFGHFTDGKCHNIIKLERDHANFHNGFDPSHIGLCLVSFWITNLLHTFTNMLMHYSLKNNHTHDVSHTVVDYVPFFVFVRFK